jgi:starch synthase
VDYSAWNPETDSLVKARFQAADPAGKKECKIDLLRSFGLPEEDIPVVGMVTRLAGQKGLDIVCDALEELFKRKLCLVILGTGEEKIESMLREGQKKFPRSLGLRVAFDDRLAHKIVAGSDLFLIPSRYEPCGLTQMYSLRYGTIPVVRATGGLDDTIQEFNPATEQGNGFKFQEYTAGALVEAVSRAVNVFQNRAKWPALVQNAMACDFSWDRSAAEYLKLYRRIYQE